jgi:hypothetical protein
MQVPKPGLKGILAMIAVGLTEILILIVYKFILH